MDKTNDGLVKKGLLLFFLVHLILNSIFINTERSANNSSRAFPVISLVENGSWQIDRFASLTVDKSFINDHYYSNKAPLPTLVVVPFFYLLNKSGLISQQTDIEKYQSYAFALGAWLCGSLPFVLILLLVYKNLPNHTTENSLSPYLLISAAFYSSFLFIYSGDFHGHLFSALLLLMAFISLRKEQFLLAGVWGGLAFASEYTLAVFVLCWAILLFIKIKKLKAPALIALGTIPGIAIVLIVNQAVTGSFHLFPHYFFLQKIGAAEHQYGFTFFDIKAIWALTFSDFRGIFFYCPILFIAMHAVLTLPNWRSKYQKVLLSPLFFPGIIFFMINCCYFQWSGGYTWGPRLLTSLAILMLYQLLPYILKIEWWGWLLLIGGLVITLFAKFTVLYNFSDTYMHPITEVLFPALMAGQWNYFTVFTLILHTKPIVGIVIWFSLFVILNLILGFYYRKSTFKKAA